MKEKLAELVKKHKGLIQISFHNVDLETIKQCDVKRIDYFEDEDGTCHFLIGREETADLLVTYYYRDKESIAKLLFG